MRTRLISTAATLVLLLSLAAPVAAVLYGTPDGNRHPYVGGLVTQFNGQNILICSGTMVSPTVFVTAAHCTDFLEELGLDAYVTLDSVFDPSAPATLYPGAMHTHPQFGLAFPATYDIAVVELAEPVNLASYATLPSANYLDGLTRKRGQQDLTLTAVGYGASGFLQKGANSIEIYDDVRRFADVKFVGIAGGYADGWNLKHSGNPGGGKGATCYGDSGGPVFSGTTLVAVTSFGIAYNCAGNGYAFRVDLADSLAFINGGYDD